MWKRLEQMGHPLSSWVRLEIRSDQVWDGSKGQRQDTFFWLEGETYIPFSYRPAERDPDVIPCATQREARFITPDVDVGETIECTPGLMEDILAAEDAPVGAVKIAVLEEDDLPLFAEYQYVIEEALCLYSDVPELMEAALRLYQGRAFYDGTGDLEEDFLDRMVRTYGLIVL